MGHGYFPITKLIILVKLLIFFSIPISFVWYYISFAPSYSVGATADWWSVGVILFELIVGIPPFNADHPQVDHITLSVELHQNMAL